MTFARGILLGWTLTAIPLTHAQGCPYQAEKRAASDFLSALQRRARTPADRRNLTTQEIQRAEDLYYNYGYSSLRALWEDVDDLHRYWAGKYEEGN